MHPPSTPQLFAPLDDPGQLDRLLEASHDRPVLIVKHSPLCGTSHQALDGLDENRDQLDGLDVYVIDVLQQRTLSQSIAQRFQVRHESPQVLLFADGRLHWSASHYRVTAHAITRAVASIPRP